MTRANLNPREFAMLVNWCEAPDGKHKRGGIQDRRRKWLTQIRDRGIQGQQVRSGAIPAEDRYLDLDDGDVSSIRGMRANPDGGTWQRKFLAIFGGVEL